MILKELKIKVPSQVKVFGYDNSLLSEIATTPIATVEQPIELMSEKAAEMLQYALNSNPSDAFACLTLGKMCHDIGKHENVALFLEQAIKCDSI